MTSPSTEETEAPVLNLKELKVISLLGRGAKGVVFLVKYNNDELQQWALKLIARENKEEDAHGDYKRVIFEKQALSLFHHPLLPTLRGVLRTDSLIGYAIDYCPGRDLNFLRALQSERMFSIELIRFYAADILLGLEYLHGQGIVYRDLKPENILIQENGHIMLVDFDLSTRLPLLPTNPVESNAVLTRRRTRSRSWLSCWVGKADVAPEDAIAEITSHVGRSNSFVGTEEYVAPEVIKGNGHGFEVDLWSYGVVLYEMLYGATPFKGGNRKETFLRILTKEPELVGETTPLRDLIRRLLVKEPAGRIGLGRIKSHEFFKGVDWGAVLTVARPPYIPPVVSGDMEGEKRIEDVEAFVRGIFASSEERKKKAAVEKFHAQNFCDTCCAPDPPIFDDF